MLSICKIDTDVAFPSREGDGDRRTNSPARNA